MAEDMDVITEKKVYWEKIGELLEGKTLTIKVDSNVIFNKKRERLIALFLVIRI